MGRFKSSSIASGQGTAISVAAPAGIIAGRRLFFYIVYRNNQTFTPPVGWTLIRESKNITNTQSALYTKIATAGEPANYTGSLSSSTYWCASVTLWQGCDIIWGGAKGIAAGGTYIANDFSLSPSVAPADGPSEVVLFVGGSGGGAYTYAGYAVATDNPATWTEEIETAQQPDLLITYAMAHGERPASTAPGIFSVSTSVAQSSNQLAALMLDNWVPEDVPKFWPSFW